MIFLETFRFKKAVFSKNFLSLNNAICFAVHRQHDLSDELLKVDNGSVGNTTVITRPLKNVRFKQNCTHRSHFLVSQH